MSLLNLSWTCSNGSTGIERTGSYPGARYNGAMEPKPPTVTWRWVARESRTGRWEAQLRRAVQPARGAAKIMEKAASTSRKWQMEHASPPRVAVNVSQLQLAQGDFAAVVEKVLKDPERGPAGVDFEITESLIMHDLEANVTKLKAIRQMGAEIAIDDFGTGHSSLSYLARLPVDILKIDRTFIAKMDISPDSLAIVTLILSLAHSLGLKVVAEGVETEAQVKMLRLLRCDEMQGYVISRPLPEDEFQAWWKMYPGEGQARQRA